MPKLKEGSECCGCTACEAICGHKAITMQSDALGFKYPKINLSKCIECGLCEKVCAFNDHYTTPNHFTQPIPYGIRLKNIEEVMKSRSGGAFVAFSDWVLAKEGVVYGVGYKDHFIVAHKRASSSQERDEFRGSKYVQSDLDGIFIEVRNDLLKGLWVMFSGTPCQVAGLQSFLSEKLKEKLVTVDIVCHGVPSPNIWRDFLTYIQTKEKKIVVGVDFRNKKDYGWTAHKETFTLAPPLTYLTTTSYTHLFYSHIMQRPSCGNCHYCNLRRPGDLTLADFWGWQKTGNHINDDDKGLSLVLVNTPTGKRIVEDVKEQFYIFEPTLQDCLQGHLKEPTLPNPYSQQFKLDYEDKGFEYVLKKYGNITTRYKLKRFLSIGKRKMLRRIKSIMK